VPSDKALEQVGFGRGLRPIYQRWFYEASATQTRV